MIKGKSVLTAVVLLLISRAHGALDIVPTFVGCDEHEWQAHQIAVVDYAIREWESAFDLNEVVEVAFVLARADGQWVAQWYVTGDQPETGDVRPWVPSLRHTIFVACDMGLWWDPTPQSDDDLPIAHDALTFIRHEIGHMMGHREGLYYNDVDGAGQIDPWAGQIVAGVFDPDGLAVRMVGADMEHTAAGGLMNAEINWRSRMSIDVASQMISVAYGYKLVAADATAGQADASSDAAAATARRASEDGDQGAARRSGTTTVCLLLLAVLTLGCLGRACQWPRRRGQGP